MIAINSYTTVRRRERVPHELFAHYWRDVHGPLCARLPGLGHYVQYHFNRDQDAHLWPLGPGIQEIPHYELDGMVEIGFADESNQRTFQAASPVLFSDEQNMFAETLAYDLPNGSLALKNTLADDCHNGPDALDRLQLHLHPRQDLDDLNDYLTNQLGPWLAAQAAVLKIRVHPCVPFVNDDQHPPSPDVAHRADSVRAALSMVEIVFASPLERRRFFASEAFQLSLREQAQHIALSKAFAVSGVYTYVHDGQLTTAGLRGSRAAELIERLGAVNQTQPDVVALLRRGSLPKEESEQ
ncbi:MAG: EthD domain-containing protein [Pseudomonas oryzihabitans]